MARDVLREEALWSGWLCDDFGLRGIQAPTDHLLSIRFATGYTIEVELRLQPPTEPG